MITLELDRNRPRTPASSSVLDTTEAIPATRDDAPHLSVDCRPRLEVATEPTQQTTIPLLPDYRSMVDRLLANPQQVEVSREIALSLMDTRWGVAYQALPRSLQGDREILLKATVNSRGHILGRAPKDVVDSLDPNFFIEAIQRGARGWILRFANEDVRSNPLVVSNCIQDWGEAFAHASPVARQHGTLQYKAIERDSNALEHAINPSLEMREFAEARRMKKLVQAT
ncbi:MAG: DUF4116 domain-containing protein [Candidatus Peregrinibacteria bacterium]|nr:DUF4116 domain-containing protein [Candidatus Peregrinibacteria bacterium]